MTIEREDPRYRATVRMGRDMADALDEIEGSKNAFIVDATRRKLERLGKLESDRDGRVPPEDPDLAAAYETLLELSNGGGTIPLESAENAIAQQMGQSAITVRYQVIKPLCRKGYCAVTRGMTAVKLLVRA